MILVNPGGPGVSGIDTIRTLASQEHIPFLGSNYDGVGWDPRGIGYAIPSANCTLTPGLKIPLGPANTKRGSLDKLYGPSLPDEYFDNVYKVAYEAGQECGGSIGGPKDAGPHMSSTTVARDMVSIVDAYAESEDGKKCQGDPLLLNYWGLSYGTFLGQVFASMFPHRVGRVVLDGVLDPDETAKETGLHQVTQTDEVFSTFFLYCHLAGPSVCSFYTGTTPHDIYLRFESMVSKLNATEALQQNWANSSAIWNLLQGMKGLINPAIQKPIENYPLIALALTGLESVLANLTLEVLEQLENGLPTPINPPLALSDLWSTGVACADNGGRYYGKKPSDFADTIRKFENVSWLGGEQQVVNQIFCSGWNITTVERYGGRNSLICLSQSTTNATMCTGPFGGKTKNPILFVSNTLDPITPIEKYIPSLQLWLTQLTLLVVEKGSGSLKAHNSSPLKALV
jgi:pimeloyl-ACP methyl ester carboxylesterase